MTIQTVVAPISLAEPKEALMMAAVGAAKKAGAHVIGLAVEDRGQGVDRAAAAAASAPSPQQAQAMLRAAEDKTGPASDRDNGAKARFEAICADQGMPLVEQEGGPGEQARPSASWVHTHDDAEGVVRAYADDSCLTVAGSSAVGRFEMDVARRALRSDGRAVLLSPVRCDGGIGNKVVIAWNASPQCWSAVDTAMPFLQHASSITVVSVVDGDLSREAAAERQDELVRYLTNHGIEATTKVADPGVRKVHDAFLTETSEIGGDLLVMGASSRHPIHQKVFGSVSAKVLDRVAATPVLMVH